MSPTIRISEQLLRYIEKYGRFGETHDAALLRLLGVKTSPKARKTEAAPVMRKQRKRGLRTQPAEFRPAILSVLLDAPGHRMPAAELVSKIRPRMEFVMNEHDHELLATGVVRWVNNCHWERAALVNDGLLEPPEKAGRGIWALTEKGRNVALDYAHRS
jgi:hypothetical protein